MSPEPGGDGPTDGVERRDPAEDPSACSKCGVHIGFGSDEYCDPCAREIGAKPPMQPCLHCGTRAPEEQMSTVDISTADEYYPEIRYLCRDCSGDDELRADGGVEQSEVPVGERDCRYCEWSVERKIRTDTDQMELDERANGHYEREHVGEARVQVTLEATWQLHPGDDPRELSERALERFEDRINAGFTPAYSRVETLEEPDPAAPQAEEAGDRDE